jgi:hypothetical protein
MTKDEAIMLEALKYAASMGHRLIGNFGPFTIKSTSAQPPLPVQEPVGSVVRWLDGSLVHGWFSDPPPEGTLLYIAPLAVQPQRTWVGLTNNELQPIADEYRILFGGWVEDFARAVETKLKEKNT